MKSVIKKGKKERGGMVKPADIAKFLFEQGLQISIYSNDTKEEYYTYIEDPVTSLKESIDEEYKQYIQGNYWIDTAGGFKFDLREIASTKYLFAKRKESIPHKYEVDMFETIHKQQEEECIFVIGVNYSVLHNKSTEGAGGHVVLVTRTKNNNELVIHDPGAPLLHYHNVPENILKKSASTMGNYRFFKVSA